jgi:hypothetical protein
VDLLHRGHREEAGIVDEDVETAELCDRPVDGPRHGARVAAVGLDRQGSPAGALDRRGDLVGALSRGQIGECDVRPGFAKPLGNRRSDPAAASRNERHLAVQIAHLRSS